MRKDGKSEKDDKHEVMLLMKKERLDIHLAEVERLIRQWILELSATDPFAFSSPDDSWGWQSAYTPGLEKDRDSNHMLRRHLKSRALWKHHADWRETLQEVFELVPVIRLKATEMHQQAHIKGRAASKKKHRTEAYLGTALWQAFRLAQNHRPNIDYKRGVDGIGVGFGAFQIETSSATKARFERIHGEHRSLCYELAELDEMKMIAKKWAQVERLRSQMHTLASRALKSSDFLNPCGFCKHLWKA